VIQDLDDPPRALSVGKSWLEFAKHSAAQGLVTNGSVRDIHQIQSMVFHALRPAFSPSHANWPITARGDSVTVDAMTIQMGDLLHGDANGVTPFRQRCRPGSQELRVLRRGGADSD